MLARPPSDPMAQPQRQSCDRCYKQKLRCTRENVSEEKACDRCSRKGVPCVYSLSLPKGRPSLKRLADESAANEAAGLRRSSAPELREAQAQTAASPTEVMHPACKPTYLLTLPCQSRSVWVLTMSNTKLLVPALSQTWPSSHSYLIQPRASVRIGFGTPMPAMTLVHGSISLRRTMVNCVRTGATKAMKSSTLSRCLQET